MISPNEISFNTLYESYHPLMENLSRKMLAAYSLPDSDYDDLVQEAAIALYTAASAFDDSRGVTFGLYAKICIKNRLASYIRSRHSNASLGKEISLESIEDEESGDITPEQLVINKESLKSLRADIDSVLTEFESSVFWLYLIGASYKDIARALSKPTKSVDNAIHRIKVKLRKLLKSN